MTPEQTNDPIVFVTEADNVTEESLQELRDVGIVVVVAKDPSKTKLMRIQSEFVGGPEIMMAALEAIRHSSFDDVKVNFANYLSRRYMEAEQPHD